MSKNNLGEMGQRLIELTGDLIAVSTKDGFFLALSQEWEDVLGFPIEDIRAKTFMNFVHPEDHQITQDCLGSLFLGLDVKNFRNRYIAKNKKIVWLEWCAVLEPATGLIYSKARMLEPDLKLEQFFLEQHRIFQANKLSILADLASGVAHELNNPLAIIVGYLQILELESQTSGLTVSADQHKMINAMTKATERATSIVANLKSLSRDASQDEFKISSLSEILDSSINLIRNRFERHKVRFDFPGIKDDVIINCRKTELSQLFFNLMLNAFEASQQENDPWIKIETSVENDQFILVMSNSGATIPPELRSKIFNPFYSTKASGFGIEMGLSFASAVIHQHGGSISIDPKAAFNSFVIKLPIFKEQQ